MRAWQGVFDEFAVAFQFPWYFGENADAMSDCITDLDWLPRQVGYVIVIDEPGEVLAYAEPNALQRLVTLLDHARGPWAQPIEQREWWDRSAVPFYVVLRSVSQLWTAAGGTVAPFPR